MPVCSPAWVVRISAVISCSGSRNFFEEHTPAPCGSRGWNEKQILITACAGEFSKSFFLATIYSLNAEQTFCKADDMVGSH